MARPTFIQPFRRALTLIELLVTISIIGAVIAVAVPTITKLTEVNQGAAGVTVVSSAVNAARVLNHRLERQSLSQVGYPYHEAKLEYRGTALVVTQSGELRLTETDQLARDQNGMPLQYEDPTGGIASVNGFKDVKGTDYIMLPKGTGIVGVVRHDGQLSFVPPPFAIRFDQNGQLSTRDRLVYYDFNGNGEYEYDNRPDPGYNPHTDSPRHGGTDHGPTGDGRQIFPYEEMPVAAAVILFDANDFHDEVGWNAIRYDQPMAADTLAWFSEYGTPIYFSPLTGVALEGIAR